MLILVQPELAERVVFRAARRDAFLCSHYEREFADCHNHPQGRARDAAFVALHQNWFESLGWNRFLRERLAECPHIQPAVARVMVRSVAGRNTQKVELLGKGGAYHVVAGVAAAAFEDVPWLTYWLRHELLHVDDILDPAFGYDASRRPGAVSAAGAALAMERFAVLWAISIDARLQRRDQLPAGVQERRRAEYTRLFSGTGGNSIAAFESLWSECTLQRVSHAAMVAQAAAAGSHDHNDSCDAELDIAPTPGLPCPLCAFPTFDWASAADVRQVQSTVKRENPAWSSALGLCGRCAELYRHRAAAGATCASGTTNPEHASR